MSDEFHHKLIELLNEESVDSRLHTPNHILAGYLIGCLDAWLESVKRRDDWYGVKHKQEWWTKPKDDTDD